MTQLRLKKIADDLIVTLPDKQTAEGRKANLEHAKMVLAEQESRGFIYKGLSLPVGLWYPLRSLS